MKMSGERRRGRGEQDSLSFIVLCRISNLFLAFAIFLPAISIQSQERTVFDAILLAHFMSIELRGASCEARN